MQLRNEFNEIISLLSHQIEALDKINYVFNFAPLRGFLLADAPRVGKTYTALAFLKVNNIKNTIILCPASIVNFWQKLIINNDINALVFSYETFRTRASQVQPAQVFILDEAHKVKNKNAQITKTVIAKASQSFVLAMTGTPFQNNPEELKTIIKVIKQPDNIVNLASIWMAEVFGRKTVWKLVWVYDKLPELNKALTYAKWYLRRELNQIKNMQKLSFSRITADINVEKFLLELLKQAESEEDKKEILNFIEGKITDNFLQRHYAKFATLRRWVGSKKATFVAGFVEELLENTKEQILLFIHHKDTAEIIIKYFQTKKINFAIINGETPQSTRADIVEKFQNSQIPILLLSIRAAGEGLNLSNAGYAVFAELDWNPAVIAQAINRMVNFNNNSNKNVIYVLADDKIETRIERIISEKIYAISQIYSKNITEILPKNATALT